MTTLTFDQAITSAIDLSEKVRVEGLERGYDELRVSLRDYEAQGFPIETIVPNGTESAIGFSLKTTDAKRFWSIYRKLIRESLCGPKGEFKKLVESGISASVGAVLTAIVTSLGIPVVALGIMVPISVIIVNIGVGAFCEMTE